MAVPLSILDLAVTDENSTAAETLAASVELAQSAERSGYRRVWYAEHHNMSAIASSSPAVLIAHVAAHTSTIRLGAGGVMLPNHAPLTIAEQFGTLEALHPGRIDLGLGRAPGTDQTTLRALRRDASSADRFPADVRELQGYLGDRSVIDGVVAYPGTGTHVPLYILGSSTFGARLAAQFGLPYANASHFSPDSLVQAVEVYRTNFRPSEQLAEPYVIAAVNAVVADTTEKAHDLLEIGTRRRVLHLIGRGRTFTRDEEHMIMSSPAAQQMTSMLRYTAVGTPDEAAAYLDAFAAHARADELIVASPIADAVNRLRSYDLLADTSVAAAA